MRKKVIVWMLMAVMSFVVLSPVNVNAEELRIAGETKPQALSSGLTSGVLMKDGSLWMWGSNEYGQVGDGTMTDRATPTKIMDNVKSAELSGVSSAAIKEDGSLWMWGFNEFGRVGDGTITNKKAPVKVLENVKTVALSDYHSAAIKEDGSLWMWGFNEYGILGDGTRTDKVIPVKIMDHVKNVIINDFCSAAIKEDGSLWMWGSNEYGQLGDGTKTDKLSPVKIMDHVKSVSLGMCYSAAVKEDGSLWMWGSNEYGQFGDGTTIDKITPVKVMDHVKAVIAFVEDTAILKEDGSLWECGVLSYTWNEQTEETIPVITAVPEKYMDQVQKIMIVEGGAYGVIKEDGSLWKFDSYLAVEDDGTYEYYNIPYKLLDYVQSVGAAGDIAVTTDGSVWTWGASNYGQLGDGRYGDDVWQDMPKKIMNGDGGKAFTDVSSSDWYYRYVNYVSANELMTGLDGDHFGPGQSLARAQFAVILYRMNGTPKVNYVSKFPDVMQNMWYTDAILWANSTGVVTGYENTGLFGTGDNITREQMAVMMYRYAGYKQYNTDTQAKLNAFTDVASVSGYAADAMRWAVGNGIITGKDNGRKLDPQGSASRAECATIMMRFIEKYGR